MTLKIQGSSIRKEFVYCAYCKKPFSWLNAYPIRGTKYNDGQYNAICRPCRLKYIYAELVDIKSK